MSLDAWTRELGTQQGRITPLGAAASSGEKVFCLGWDVAGHFDEFAHGDFAQIEQTATFTADTKLFRVRASVRPPLVIPDDFEWTLSLLVDGVEAVTVTLVAGANTRIYDLAANVSKLAGPHTIAVRLLFDRVS